MLRTITLLVPSVAVNILTPYLFISFWMYGDTYQGSTANLNHHATIAVMKIGIILPYDITKGGGVREIVFTQVHGLRRRGHQVLLITPRPRNYKEAPEEGIIFLGSSTDWRSSSTTVQISAGLISKIDAMLKEEQFDILHFHEPWIPMLSLQILNRSNAVNVATFHARQPDKIMVQTMSKAVMPYLKSVLKYIDVYTAASIMGAQYISTLTDKPITIVPVDIDLDVVTPPKKYNDTKTAKTILYTGRLEGRKGVQYLLKAFQLLQDRYPEISLDILGDGVDRASLEKQAHDLRLERVAFLGYRDDAEKIHRLQTADLYCSPAIYGEGFGKVLLEAMATGLPAVVGNNPGYASVMTGLGTLSLVDPKDTQSFTHRLELLLYENDLRALWRKWALQEVQQYSTEHMLDQYEAIYTKALA